MSSSQLLPGTDSVIQATLMRAAVAKALLRLLALMPLGGTHYLGRVLGWWLLITPNRTRLVAQTNIALCFPLLTAKEQGDILRQSLIETGKALMETGAMWLWKPERLVPLVSKVSGEDAVQRSFGQGKGVIFLTPHLGSWEIAGLYAAARYPMTILYRPPRLIELDNLIRQARARTGARLATTDTAGVRTLLQTLNSGGVLGILPDQEPAWETGIFSTFFGIPAYTMVLVSRLAQKTKAPVFIAYCQRLDKGRGYHLHFEPLADKEVQGELEKSVASINHAVERCVRKLPTQYQWGYKRFRRRPAGEPKLYPKVR